MELLGRKEGTVGNDNFTYYYIHHLGNILLSLKTKYTNKKTILLSAEILVIFSLFYHTIELLFIFITRQIVKK